MKTIKLKCCNSITIANQLAPLGRMASGAVIFEVTNVPDHISAAKVSVSYANYALAQLGVISVVYDGSI